MVCRGLNTWGSIFRPLGKLYLEVSRNTYSMKGVLFCRANIQWCGLWKSKLAANSFITCPFAISCFLPILLWFKSFLLGTFPPFKWFLARPKLGCTILFPAAEWNCESRQCLWSQGNGIVDATFLVFNLQERWSGCSVFPPLPQEGPCCPSLLEMSLPAELPAAGLGLCCSSESGLQKAFQGHAKGVGGSSLTKPGSRTSSALSSPQEYGLKELRPWEGSYSLKINRRQIFRCVSVWKCCI